MTTRDIQAQWQEWYGVEVSPTLISNATEAVMDEVRKFQARPLEALYSMVYFDGLAVNVRQNQRVINKALHLALGVNLSGHKELLGMWLAETRGRQVLAGGADRTSEPRGERHFYCLCGWADGVPRSYSGGLSRGARAPVAGRI
jgi:hypothetical protein